MSTDTRGAGGHRNDQGSVDRQCDLSISSSELLKLRNRLSASLEVLIWLRSVPLTLMFSPMMTGQFQVVLVLKVQDLLGSCPILTNCRDDSFDGYQLFA